MTLINTGLMQAAVYAGWVIERGSKLDRMQGGGGKQLPVPDYDYIPSSRRRKEARGENLR